MDEIIGQYRSIDLRSCLVHATLTLNPPTFPLRWSHCATTSEFLAHYLGTFFRLPAPSEGNPQTESVESHAMNYVLNELIENAVKYSEGGTVSIQVGLVTDEIILLVENEITTQTIETLRSRLLEIISNDPSELFVRRVEAKEENPDDHSSGLGFITMITDYDARLGWRLAALADHPDRMLLSTMARLAIQNPPTAARAEG